MANYNSLGDFTQWEAENKHIDPEIRHSHCGAIFMTWDHLTELLLWLMITAMITQLNLKTRSSRGQGAKVPFDLNSGFKTKVSDFFHNEDNKDGQWYWYYCNSVAYTPLFLKACPTVQIVIRDGPESNKRILNLNNVRMLLFFHAFTGCDYSPSFFWNWKGSILQWNGEKY